MSTPLLQSCPSEQLENFTGDGGNVFIVSVETPNPSGCLLLEFRCPLTAPGDVQLERRHTLSACESRPSGIVISLKQNGSYNRVIAHRSG